MAAVPIAAMIVVLAGCSAAVAPEVRACEEASSIMSRGAEILGDLQLMSTAAGAQESLNGLDGVADDLLAIEGAGAVGDGVESLAGEIRAFTAAGGAALDRGDIGALEVGYARLSQEVRSLADACAQYAD